MSDETQFVCPHCKQKIKHCAGLTYGDVMSLRHNKKHQEILLERLRAENEKLRAALKGWQEWWEAPWQEKRPDVAELRYRAAKAALGESNE